MTSRTELRIRLQRVIRMSRPPGRSAVDLRSRGCPPAPTAPPVPAGLSWTWRRRARRAPPPLPARAPRPTHLTSGPKVPARSISWKAPRPRTSRRTWPTIATSGAESDWAASRPIVRLAAPGDLPGQHHCRTAGQLTHCLGHEGRGSLVASGHDSDSLRGQPFQEPDEALAGDGEGELDARSGECFGQGRADR